MSNGTSFPGRRHWLVLLMFLAVVVGYSDRVNISVAAVSMKEELAWTQTTKGLVLSAFFIGYIAFMAISGWLAMRYGGKRVLGLAMLWWSVFTLLTPIAAATSVPLLITTRIGMGVGEAAMFPAIFEMLGRWVPPAERTRSVAFITSGISLGTVIGLLATGWIVGQFAWPAAFYSFGIVGLLLTAVWYAAVSDDPHSDPRVPQSERTLLIAAGSPADPQRQHLPWRALLLRPAVLALMLTHFAVTWTLYMLLSWMPSYFRDVQGVSIANSGLLSAAPWLSMFVMTYVAAAVSDIIARRTGRIAFTRKLMQGIGLVGSGALLLLAQQAQSVPMALAIVCGATGLLGFCWAGYTPNFLDLAPLHSGVLMGFSNTFATIPGIVGVAATGWLVDVTGTYTAAFALAAGVSAAGALVFMIFGSSEPLAA